MKRGGLDAKLITEMALNLNNMQYMKYLGLAIMCQVLSLEK